MISNMPRIDLILFLISVCIPKTCLPAKTTTLHVSIISVYTFYIRTNKCSCSGVFTWLQRLSCRVHKSALRHARTKAKRRLPTSVQGWSSAKIQIQKSAAEQLRNAVHHVQSQPLSPCRRCPCCFVPIENIRIH